MRIETPAWRREAQNIIPKWGTKVPMRYGEVATTHLFSTDGRPLLELETPQFNLAGVPFDYQISRWEDGGRKDMRVNMSAHRSVMRDINKSLAVISYLRSEMYPDRTTLDREAVADVVQAAIGLPYWLVLKADNPTTNGEIPTYITGVTKVARGLNIPFDDQTLRDTYPALRDRGPDINKEELNHPGSYVSVVFDNDLVLSGEGADTACTASRTLIDRFAKLLFNGQGNATDISGLDLHLTAGDIARVRNFGSATNLGEFIDAMFEDVFLKNNDNALKLIQGEIIPVAIGGELTDFVEYYLFTANSIDQVINETLGREMPPERTREDLVLEVYRNMQKKYTIADNIT